MTGGLAWLNHHSRFLQPVLPLKVQIRCQAREDHKDNCARVAESPLQFRHKLEVHPVAGSDQRRRQEHNGYHREDLDDAVLLDVDKAHRRLHQEVHLLEQRLVMWQQGFDISQDLARLLQLPTR